MNDKQTEQVLQEASSHSSTSRQAVFSTWNEKRTKEFPQVIKYREDWRFLGFDVEVTPKDVLRLVQETRGNEHLLQVFDDLETKNMQFDFWRYAKLYLDGGLYADVDVQPRMDIFTWREASEKHHSVVIFEESPTWMAHSKIFRLIRPLVSNLQEIPSYASCVVIAPEPRAPFFLELLQAVDPNQWKNTPEPRKTLMVVGPGHLTQFAKNRNDVIVASRNDGRLAYTHRGFGTWKPTGTLLFEKLPHAISLLLSSFLVFVYLKRRCRGKLVGLPSDSSQSLWRQEVTSSTTFLMDDVQDYGKAMHLYHRDSTASSSESSEVSTDYAVEVCDDNSISATLARRQSCRMSSQSSI